MENILNVVLPYIVTVIGGYLTVKITKIVPSVISYIIAKVGVVNYNKMKDIGLDIFNAIEENERIGKLTDSKIQTFNSTIKTKFPNITDTDINLVRQAISREFNKDKAPVEKAIEEATATGVPTDTNTPVATPNDPTQATNADVITQLKDLISKL